jgi:hypothetical protein
MKCDHAFLDLFFHLFLAISFFYWLPNKDKGETSCGHCLLHITPPFSGWDEAVFSANGSATHGKRDFKRTGVSEAAAGGSNGHIYNER